MKKQRIIGIAGICVILLASVLPMVIFRDKLQVTRYSIPAICLLAFHVLYGLAACLFRHKGNYLRFRVIFIRFFFFNFLDPDREYTFTREYKRQFNRMLALYCVVLPLYAPCVFLTSTPAAMPLALIVFLLPQAVFIIAETRGLIGDVKDAKQDRKLRERELEEQKKREEAGRWR